MCRKCIPDRGIGGFEEQNTCDEGGARITEVVKAELKLRKRAAFGGFGNESTKNKYYPPIHQMSLLFSMLTISV